MDRADFAITIAGAGAAAKAFTSCLRAKGARVVLWSRKPEDAARLAEEFDAETSADLSVASGGALLLCVSDSALSSLSAELAESGVRPDVALHVSGFHDASALEPLAVIGTSTASLHPLCALSDRAEALRGALFTFEGDPSARRVARNLVEACDGKLIDLPESATSGNAKHAYHAAAALVSNGTVALFDAALDLVGRNSELEAGLCSLLESTLGNLRELGVPDALTGPALRGDAEVLIGHLEQLDSSQRAIYGPLTLRMLELAKQRGALTEADVERLRELL